MTISTGINFIFTRYSGELLGYAIRMGWYVVTLNLTPKQFEEDSLYPKTYNEFLEWQKTEYVNCVLDDINLMARLAEMRVSCCFRQVAFDMIPKTGTSVVMCILFCILNYIPDIMHDDADWKTVIAHIQCGCKGYVRGKVTTKFPKLPTPIYTDEVYVELKNGNVSLREADHMKLERVILSHCLGPTVIYYIGEKLKGFYFTYPVTHISKDKRLNFKDNFIIIIRNDELMLQPKDLIALVDSYYKKRKLIKLILVDKRIKVKEMQVIKFSMHFRIYYIPYGATADCLHMLVFTKGVKGGLRLYSKIEYLSRIAAYQRKSTLASEESF
jgi:hypothetical protein